MATRDLQQRRNGAIDQLSDAFANDKLELAEFERRLALAHRAEDDTAIDDVVRDLPAHVEVALAPVSQTPALRSERPMMRVILGSITRRGAWSPPQTMEARATLGSVELDYRDAVLQPGINELHVKTFMGSIEITVPPHLPVIVDGTAFLGSFEHIDRAPAVAPPGVAVLRIIGNATLGSVEVITKLPKQR